MKLEDLLSSTTSAGASPGDLVDEREASMILRVSVQTLRNWRWKREGPRYKKLGKRLVRYARSDLAEFISGENPV